MIILASDHAGFELKEKIKAYLKKNNIEFKDIGTNSNDSVDYPLFANKMAEELKVNSSLKGILLCGTGIGMSIAINRYSHIRGALCKDKKTAKMTRLHNDANVLILAGRDRYTNFHYKSIVKVFVETQFEGGRHKKRIDMLCK